MVQIEDDGGRIDRPVPQVSRAGQPGTSFSHRHFLRSVFLISAVLVLSPVLPVFVS